MTTSAIPEAGLDAESRRYAALSVAGVTLFWLGVLIGGSLAPGYRQSRDYISALASRGSAVAPIGIAAIASQGLGFLFGGLFVLRRWRSRAAGLPMVLAGLSVVVVAAFRIGCPDGAAGCGFGAFELANDFGDVVHRDAVIAFELFLLLAMAALALGSLRRPPWPRWLGWVSVPMGIASVLLLASTGGELNGVIQKLWAGTNSAWLLLVVWAAKRSARTNAI
jgi:hypothetical protein